MTILYLHGFASAVKTQNKKYDELAKISPVSPFAPDYCQGFAAVMHSCLEFVQSLPQVSAVVGTSMGGYTASHLAECVGVPFVAINPPLSPSQSLQKYLGIHQSYDGSEYNLGIEQVHSYPDYNPSAAGLIVVSQFDELVAPQPTQAFAKQHGLPIISCAYGDHRFEDISALIPAFQQHIQTVTQSAR
ncbi:MAG: hypothetical protein M0Q29_01180 [Thiopseudomonas sp.]|nr:hypothetical protein [Thiopseudomonas sp.]MCK9464479.1 hypothetical protein [Thiopseudomonas sp.]